MGEDLTLEHIIFLCGAAAGISLSAFGVISNFLMRLHVVSVIIPFINLVVDVSCVFYSIVKKRWHGAAVVLYAFASFVLFPFLWFTTGGTMSSSLPLVIGLGVILAIVFSGRQRFFFFFTTLAVYSALILVELYIPNNFVPYPSREAWYIDVLFGFVMSFLASGGVAYFTLIRYNEAKSRAERLVGELEIASMTDPLTRVFNRRHLMTRIDEEMRSAYDSGEPLSLCIIDVDKFKSVNDTYGHLYGDEVLVKVSATIASCLGKGEVFGRYGGEEFIILFMNRDLEATLRIIESFYEALRRIEWPNDMPITVSTGVSTYLKGVSYSKFLEQADTQLYKAKANGRNRIEH